MNEILRKLTIATCGWDQSAIKAALSDKPKIDLLKVVGVCQTAQSGASALGDYIKLVGEFRGINLDTGEIYAATRCILPNFIAEGIAYALSTSENVEFGILIGAKAKAGSVTGYEFTVKPLIEPKVNDQLEKLMLIATQVTPMQALEAPTGKKAK